MKLSLIALFVKGQFDSAVPMRTEVVLYLNAFGQMRPHNFWETIQNPSNIPSQNFTNKPSKNISKKRSVRTGKRHK